MRFRVRHEPLRMFTGDCSPRKIVRLRSAATAGPTLEDLESLLERDDQGDGNSLAEHYKRESEQLHEMNEFNRKYYGGRQ